MVYQFMTCKQMSHEVVESNVEYAGYHALILLALFAAAEFS